MTVRELLEHLQLLARNHADANIVCRIGVLKGIVQQKLKDDADFDRTMGVMPVVSFLDDATSVYVDENEPDEPPVVVINAGVDMEIPPIE